MLGRVSERPCGGTKQIKGLHWFLYEFHNIDIGGRGVAPQHSLHSPLIFSSIYWLAPFNLLLNRWRKNKRVPQHTVWQTWFTEACACQHPFGFVLNLKLCYGGLANWLMLFSIFPSVGGCGADRERKQARKQLKNGATNGATARSRVLPSGYTAGPPWHTRPAPLFVLCFGPRNPPSQDTRRKICAADLKRPFIGNN